VACGHTMVAPWCVTAPVAVFLAVVVLLWTLGVLRRHCGACGGTVVAPWWHLGVSPWCHCLVSLSCVAVVVLLSLLRYVVTTNLCD